MRNNAGGKGIRREMTESEEAILEGWEDQYFSRSECWRISQVGGSLSARALLDNESRDTEGTDSATVTFPVNEMAEQPPDIDHQIYLGPEDNESAQLRYNVTRAEYDGSPLSRLTLARI